MLPTYSAINRCHQILVALARLQTSGRREQEISPVLSHKAPVIEDKGVFFIQSRHAGNSYVTLLTCLSALRLLI